MPKQITLLDRLAKMTPLHAIHRIVVQISKFGLAHLLWLAWRLRLTPQHDPQPGPTANRLLIAEFIKQYAPQCQGVFLEFGDPYYRGFFTDTAIQRYEIIDIVPRPHVTLLGDIQDCPQIADASFDVIVCTQVLEHIANPFKAAAELGRILKPGGRLLLTVPAAYPYHGLLGDYWRYTRDSLRQLFAPCFTEIQINGYGNAILVAASYWGWRPRHLPRAALTRHDPDSPSLLCLYAVKPVSG